MLRFLKSYIKTHWIYYLFVTPFFILFSVFVIAPVTTSIYYSFSYYNVLEPARFLGAANYIKLFTGDDVFLTAIKNTVVIAGITGPISFLLCFFLAWLINDLKPKLRTVFTLTFYIPSLITSVFPVWLFIFSGDRYGFVNDILLKLNLIDIPIVFLKTPRYMMFVLIIVSLWMSLGTSFLAFIAGFQGLDKALFEAGEVEGIKNRWQELWYITAPCMRPQLLFAAVIQITGAFSVGEIGDLLFGFPSVEYATHSIMNHLMDYGGVRLELGYASAIATVLFIIMVGSNKIANRLLWKVGE